MKNHKLSSNETIPAIGFGTWKLWRSNQAYKAVSEALRAGYRLIDTARIYNNEKGVGKAIQESGIAREQIFVTTKLWNNRHGYDNANKALHDSLKRLGLDYVDLYLIHWPYGGKIEETWQAFEEFYEKKLARSIGVSNFAVHHLESLMSDADIMPMVNQIEFHPFVFEQQKDILDFCKKYNIILEAYSPLAGGKHMEDKVITELAAKHGKNNAQIMLRWCVQHGVVPIPKSAHPDRMKSNNDIFDFSLSVDDMKKLNSLSQNFRTCPDPHSIP